MLTSSERVVVLEWKEPGRWRLVAGHVVLRKIEVASQSKLSELNSIRVWFIVLQTDIYKRHISVLQLPNRPEGSASVLDGC